MAKPVAPLFGFDARGTLAKAIVFSSWRGRAYVRRWVSPAQPRTAPQVETRNTFTWLMAVYKRAPALMTQVWQLAAKGRPLTDRNLFAKDNLGQLIGMSDLDLLVLSPGALGGLPPAAAVITPGADQLSVAVTVPDAPPDWTLTSAIAAALPDQDPQSGTNFVITAGEDTSAPYTIVLTGLTVAGSYQVRTWLKWMKPDGSTAYSPDIADQATPA